MRSEDDLRTALTSLEEHAPVAARVLPGLAPRRSGYSRLSARWVAGIAATAAVAGAITAVTVTTQNAPAASSLGPATGAPTGKTAQAKLLAAFSSIAGDVAYQQSWIMQSGKNGLQDRAEVWAYPAGPTKGQQVTVRTVNLDNKGNPTADTEVSYTDEEPKKQTSTTVDYAMKTWWNHTNFGSTMAVAQFFTLLDPSIKANDFKQVGTGTVDGQRAIEFNILTSRQKPSNATSGAGGLWVNATTYQPLRYTMSGSGNGNSFTSQVDFEFLPPTAANLAKLTPPIPAGFQQVAYAPPGQPLNTPTPTQSPK